MQYLIFFDLLWHVIMIKKWDQNSNNIYILVGNLCNIKKKLTKYDFFFNYLLLKYDNNYDCFCKIIYQDYNL